MSDHPLEYYRSVYGELAEGVREILYSEDQIQQRVAQLGQAISLDYQGKNPLLIGVLKGMLFFMADLLRSITIPVEVDFMAISNYSPAARDQGIVRVVKDLEIPLGNRHVVFIEDVIDTGLTLNYLLKYLRNRQPSSLEVCALFDKNRNRLIDLPIRYKGFDLPDRFVVGYGLDFKEQYRNLPFVGLLKSEIIHKTK